MIPGGGLILCFLHYNTSIILAGFGIHREYEDSSSDVRSDVILIDIM